MANLKITQLEAVVTPADADLVEVVQDVATTPVNRKITWTQIKAFLKTYFDTIYLKLTGGNITGNLNVSGNVGIGATGPLAKLHVAGTGRFDLPTVGIDSYLRITSALATDFDTYLGTTANNQYAWFTNIRYDGASFVRDNSSKSAWRMNQVVGPTDAASEFALTYWNPSGTISFPLIIKGTGDVGIGTIEPTARLELSSADIIETGIKFTNISAGGKMWRIRTLGSSVAGRIGNLSIRNATDLINAVEIKISGDIGIGTTDPTAKVDILSNILRLRTAKTPASAGAAGNAGDICWDANYIYICIATNTWKRSAIIAW